MDSLKYHLDLARYTWKQRVDANTYLQQKWEDISFGLFSNGVNGHQEFLDFVNQYEAFDALSFLIEFNDEGIT